jgi:uncharacterized protein (UPF0332 family)
MTIDELVRQGSIRAFQAKPDEIARAMELARRDLAFASKLVDQNLDWCYSIAYNAVLQASRAFMFKLGYRPAATETHKVTLEFMALVVDESLKGTVLFFDRVRKKRHRTVYDEVGLVSQPEAKNLLVKAGEYLAYVAGKVAA